MKHVGVISDTHGLLRPELMTSLAGVDHILHAGDVGDASILARLAEIAPVSAVRGNVDTVPSLARLPFSEAVMLDGHLLYMVHRLQDLDLDPVVAGVSAVITGHTHRAVVETCNGVLYLNPGSVGPRRFSLPITFAVLRIGETGVETEVIPLIS